MVSYVRGDSRRLAQLDQGVARFAFFAEREAFQLMPLRPSRLHELKLLTL